MPPALPHERTFMVYMRGAIRTTGMAWVVFALAYVVLWGVNVHYELHEIGLWVIGILYFALGLAWQILRVFFEFLDSRPT